MPRQDDRDPGASLLTEQEARQGEVGRDRFVRGPMRYVLGISLALAVVALLLVYLIYV